MYIFFLQHLCFGYPFFLSLSDVAVMLDLVNFRPSVPQTDYCFFCRLCRRKKEKKREENGKSQKNLKLKDKRKTHLYISKNLRKTLKPTINYKTD